MRLPVEVIANRAPEVVEVRDVVAQFVCDVLHLVRGGHHLVRRGDHLLHEGIHVLHDGDGLAEHVGLLEHVVHPRLLEVQELLLAGLLHAQHVRNRGVGYRGSLGPGHGLHLGDSGDVEYALGQLVEHQEVCWVAQVVIRLDHQDLR